MNNYYKFIARITLVVLAIEKVSSWQESCDHFCIVATDRRANVSCERGNQRENRKSYDQRREGNDLHREGNDLHLVLRLGVRLSEGSISINYCQIRCMLMACA